MKLTYTHTLVLLIVLFTFNTGYCNEAFKKLYDKALKDGSPPAAQTCLDYANLQGEPTEIAKATLLLAYNAIKSDMYYIALDSYFSALELYRALDDKKTQADIIESIGIIYRRANAYDQAISYYSDALNLKLEIGDSTQLARSYYNIGRVYRMAEQYNSAIKFFNLAMSIYEFQNNWQKVSETNNEIGIAYAGQQQYDEALRYYNKITDMLEQGSECWIKQETLRLNNLASLRLRQNDFAGAKLLIREATTNANYKAAMMPQIRSLLYINLAKVYEHEMQHDSLMFCYKMGIDIADNDFDPEIILGYRTLARYYSETGEAQSAINYYDKLSDIAIRMSELQQELKIRNIQYQVDAATYKKQKELAAAAEVRTKIIYMLVNGVGGLMLLMIGRIAWNRYQKNKEAVQLDANDILDNVTR